MKKMKCCEYNSCGLYYKHMTIINDESSIVNKLGASLTDDARVVIYNRHVYSTGHRSQLPSPQHATILTK